MIFFHPLYRELYSDVNLNRAWRAVRRAGTATGLDAMTATQFEAHAFILLKQLQEDLRRFQYRPQAVKRIFMKREVGPPRRLGIPTFVDRIVQRALVQVLAPRVEPHFDECSHAYRTGRSPQTAIAQAKDFARNGRSWVAKLDLSDCFGNIPHRPLLRSVFHRVHDCAVRRLLARMLAVEIVTE
ncbi:MAG: reverse transcriptase domain-containing protein, partial [candidate division KSB1 bacterium]